MTEPDGGEPSARGLALRAPPTQGLKVREEPGGFHARIWPDPPPPWRRWGVAAGLMGAAALALAALVGGSLASRLQVALAILGFGLLLALTDHVRGWIPVEVQLDAHTVYWNGERYPRSAVRGARADGQKLSLLGADGRPCAELDHVPAEAARWLAEAIDAALGAETRT